VQKISALEVVAKEKDRYIVSFEEKMWALAEKSETIRSLKVQLKQRVAVLSGRSGQNFDGIRYKFYDFVISGLPREALFLAAKACVQYRQNKGSRQQAMVSCTHGL